MTPAERRVLLRALDQAGWTRLADSLVRGICHDLNGRANGLSNTSFLLSSGKGPPPDLGANLASEVDALENAVRLLRLLPDDGSGPGVVAPGDFLHPGAELMTLQPGWERIQVHVDLPAGTPALRVDETLFFRSMLLLLSGVGDVLRQEGVGRVLLQGVGASGAFRITSSNGTILEGNGGSGAEAGERRGSGRAFPSRKRGLMGEVLAGMGGSLVLSEGAGSGASVQVSFPPVES